MIGDYLCRVLLHCFGYLYPAYCTYKVVEAKDAAAIQKWCKYWLILALFTTAERMVLDWTVFWIPLYYEGKLVFVLWLWHSSSNGASTLYSRVLSPLLRQHEGTIDHSLGEAQALVFDYGADAVRWSITFIKENAYLLTGYLQMLKSSRDDGAQRQAYPQVKRKPPTARAPSGQDSGQLPYPDNMPSWMYPQDNLQPGHHQHGGSRPASRPDSRGGSMGGEPGDLWGSPERSERSHGRMDRPADDGTYRSRSPSPEGRLEQRKGR